MECILLKDVKACLKALIVSCPHVLTIEQLNKNYRKWEGENIPYARLGYRRLEPFLRSLTDTLEVHGSGPCAPVTANNVEKIQHIDKMVSRSKNTTLGRRRQTAINNSKQQQQQQEKQQKEQMCIRRTNGNHLNNVKEQEEKTNRMKFTIKNPSLINKDILHRYLFADYVESNPAALVKENEIDLLRNKVNENVKQLPKSREIELPKSCEKLREEKLPKQQEELKEVEKKSRKNSGSEAIPELSLNNIVFLLDFPSDSVKFGEKILHSEIPSNIVEGDKPFGLFIVEVHNPYKFWFHNYKEEHELDTLMQAIADFYETLPANKLQMAPNRIKAEQICAAIFDSNGDKVWHRAEILDNPNGQYVKVCYVDYGTIRNIDISNIKYLLHEFSILPRQALRGSLANIKPIGHRWTREATVSFVSMVSNDKFLYGLAKEIDHKDRVVHMLVIDTNNEKDFKICNALIMQGHARICEE